mmetsp:Transcript_27487/g.64139  ORF Transcript_27487/g.64139 Transcript_27487/m.64139 type:complete len:354 (+) Transcript_27487:4079-5140(+)
MTERVARRRGGWARRKTTSGLMAAGGQGDVSLRRKARRLAARARARRAARIARSGASRGGARRGSGAMGRRPSHCTLSDRRSEAWRRRRARRCRCCSHQLRRSRRAAPLRSRRRRSERPTARARLASGDAPRRSSPTARRHLPPLLQPLLQARLQPPGGEGSRRLRRRALQQMRRLRLAARRRLASRTRQGSTHASSMWWCRRCGTCPPSEPSSRAGSRAGRRPRKTAPSSSPCRRSARCLRTAHATPPSLATPRSTRPPPSPSRRLLRRSRRRCTGSTQISNSAKCTTLPRRTRRCSLRYTAPSPCGVRRAPHLHKSSGRRRMRTGAWRVARAGGRVASIERWARRRQATRG